MNVWRLMAHHQPENYDRVINWIKTEGVIAIGWSGTGDLRQHSISDAKALTNIVNATHSIGPANHSNGGRSLWRLYNDLNIGDLVIVNTHGRMLTMRVTGGYFYQNGDFYYQHRRKAEEVPVDPNKLWNLSGGMAQGENVRLTLFRCSNGLSDAQYNALL